MTWRETDQQFVNPYNFAMMSDRYMVRKTREDWFGDKEKRLTGSINCRLSVVTPLALPDHAPTSPAKIEFSDVKDNDGKIIGKHFSYPYVSIDGKTPMIPGSELRGMIRNVYETVTNSCMSVFDNSPLTGRSSEPKKPGILIKEADGWMLYDTDMFLVDTFGFGDGRPARYPTSPSDGSIRADNGSQITTGAYISFDIGKPYYKRNVLCGYYAENLCGDNAKHDGLLLLGERGIGKTRHHSHIISLSHKKADSRRTVDEACVKNFEAVLKCYGDSKLNGCNSEIHGGYKSYAIKESGTPVFYSETFDPLKKTRLYHFSPAMLSREVYYSSLSEIAGVFAPCGDLLDRNQKNETDKAADKRVSPICPACALFGMISSGKTVFGSAVRFSDAVLVKGSELKTMRTMLKELAGAKISAGEMYLERPLERYYDSESRQYKTRANTNARTWNFEYYRQTNDADARIVDHIKYTPKLRGRKFFFHNRNAAYNPSLSAQPLPPYETREKTVRNATVELITKADFSFTVYFENISPEQLRVLTWCIAPKDGEKDLCHKLGLGKPLGLGSIKTEIERVHLRNYDCNTGEYKSKPCNKYSKVCDAKDLFMHGGKYPPSVRAMLAFLDYNTIGKNIHLSYPLGDNGGQSATSVTSMQWFVGNKQIKGTGTNPCISKVLPTVKETMSGVGLNGLRKE